MNGYSLRRHALGHGTLVQRAVVPDHLSASAWYRAHHNGELIRVHAGVSRPSCTPETHHLRIEAALAAAMPGCAVAGPTAAWLWGSAAAWRRTIDLIAPPGRHPGRLDGVVFHRPTDTAMLVTVKVAGFPVCDPVRSTLDLAAWHPTALSAAIDELLALGRLDIGALRDGLQHRRRHGRPGVATLERELRLRAANQMAPGMPSASG